MEVGHLGTQQEKSKQAPLSLLLLLLARIPLLRFGGKNPTFAIRLQVSHLQENMIYEHGDLNMGSER